jgi:hypothetical protein
MAPCADPLRQDALPQPIQQWSPSSKSLRCATGREREECLKPATS